MKTKSSGIAYMPTFRASERKSFYDRMNQFLPADSQIETRKDQLAVKTLVYVSITLVCPLFIIPVIVAFIQYKKEGGKE